MSPPTTEESILSRMLRVASLPNTMRTLVGNLLLVRLLVITGNETNIARRKGTSAGEFLLDSILEALMCIALIYTQLLDL